MPWSRKFAEKSTIFKLLGLSVSSYKKLSMTYSVEIVRNIYMGNKNMISFLFDHQTSTDKWY